jgi:omega-6 fatty acid desaturase (delta-12 desaturase)
VWVPDIAKDNEKEKAQLLQEAKITKRNIVRILLVSILGWPMYLYTNYGAAKTKEPNNHFTYCKMFHSKPRWTVLISTYGLVAWAATLLVISYYVGLFKLIGLYVLPYGVVNFFLVTITFLQHKDEKVPHLTDHSYEWLRAALCTVDRSMGSYLDNKLHLIHVTHVAHHLFSYIPFYHSTEVTEAIKPILGPYYVKDERNYWYCLWNHYKYWGTIENNDTAIHYWFLGTS